MAETETLEDPTARLPEHIIQHILSFLKTKEAARTGVLSKAWLSAWQTRPILEISHSLFSDKNANSDAKKREKSLTKFIEYLNKTLVRYNEQKTGIQTFKLELNSTFRLDSYVISSTIIAVQNGVQNLDFSIPGYTLPLVVLEAKTLVDLRVRRCVLEQQNVRCHLLKKLSLVMVSLDEVVFNKIVSCCRLIEDLEIANCDGLEVFKVTKLQNLKMFVIILCEDQRVEIEAPSLEFLICRNQDVFSPPDWKPCGFNLHTPRNQNLKSLFLCGVDISPTFFFNFESSFPCLEDLAIQHCKNLERIRISSPSLQRLLLLKNKDLKVAQFDVPSIVNFNYLIEGKVIPDLAFTAGSGHWFSDIRITCLGNVDTSWFLKLKVFMTKLTESEMSVHLSFRDSVEFNVDEMRNNLVLPQPQVKEVTVCYSDWIFSSSTPRSILDGIFWTCHLQIKFWQRVIKDVKVEIIEGGERVELPEALDLENRKPDVDFLSPLY